LQGGGARDGSVSLKTRRLDSGGGKGRGGGEGGREGGGDQHEETGRENVVEWGAGEGGGGIRRVGGGKVGVGERLGWGDSLGTEGTGGGEGGGEGGEGGDKSGGTRVRGGGVTAARSRCWWGGGEIRRGVNRKGWGIKGKVIEVQPSTGKYPQNFSLKRRSKR